MLARRKDIFQINTYTWNGSGFNEVSFLPSQILTDVNSNLNYYDQNYVQFYPVAFTVTNSVSAFTLDYNSFYTPPSNGAVYTDNPGLSGYVPSLQLQLIQDKYNSFSNSEFFNSYTQTIPSLVANTVNAALSAFPASGATAILNAAAPAVVDPGLNFSLNEILNNWPGGAQVISSLSDILSNTQTSTVGQSRAVQSVIDFKTKLLRQAAVNADSIRGVQANNRNFMSQNTFGPMASSFPMVNNLNNVINNNNLTNITAYTGLLPSILAKNTSSFLGPALQSVLGSNSSSWATLVNPNDKILNDVMNLQSQGSNLAPAARNISGFSNVSSMTSFVNQSLGVVNNALNQVPTTATTTIPPSITNAVQILQGFTVYANETLVSGSTGATSSSEQSLLTLLGYMQRAGPPASTKPADPTDSALGGSLMGLLNPFMPTQSDPTISGFSATLSSDATIQASQLARAKAQVAANIGANTGVATADQCVNPILPPPQTPRMISVTDLSPTQYPPNTTLQSAFGNIDV